jgi:hypothetical protein
MFAQQKQAANSQAQGYGANPVVQTQPVATPTTQVKTSPLVSNTKPQNTYGQITSMDDLARAMNYTTPEEEDRLRKASVANQRIMAIGDALRHIGNIANTVNYAPSQQFNNPVQEEHQRYLQGKALRDAANRQYLAYQQQKAAQDAKQRQWEATFNYNAARDAANAQALKERYDADREERARQADQTHGLRVQQVQDQKERYERQAKETNRHNTRMEGIAGMNAKTNRDRATAYINHLNSGSNRGAGGSTRAGHTYATKNGSVTLPADYLKDKINKRTILTQLEREGVINQDWLNRYDLNQWNEKKQEQMLDDAVSSWLMNYDQAEGYMEKHFRGQRGGSATSAGTMPGVGGSSNNTMPGVKH